ncbi:MAG TPA: hypothetical protein VFH29_05790, partial [Anaerolineales bacterium]|nr:hypothetical protein [Anaerolineales bacterium]
AADQLLRGAPLGSVYPRGLWVVTLPVALALRLLGHEVWAARTIGVVFNVLALAPLYALSRKISRAAAVAIGLLYACSPWIITFARVAREYAYYPLYFYLIVWLMIELVEAVPPGFVLARDWRQLMHPKVALLALALLVPPIFALRIDWLSTFRTILIAYLVLGAFLLSRFDWKARANWPTLGVLVTALVAVGGYFYREQLTKLLFIPKVNPVPLSYFFPNPPQQWYFDRLGLIAGIAVVVAATGATLHRRRAVVPLFMVSLFAAYLLVFALFSKSFFHTRHLLSTQLWFLAVVGIGLAWIWEWLRGQFAGHRTAAAIIIALMLGALVLNPAQILLPTLSRNPDMPISEDYLHDMSAVQQYLLQHANQGDALISTVYGLYATWEHEPAFGTQLRINSGTSRDEIAGFVQEQESGWIVIDSIRLDMSTLSEHSITSLPRMEYIGYFGDEHVWRWGGARALSSANAF